MHTTNIPDKFPKTSRIDDISKRIKTDIERVNWYQALIKEIDISVENITRSIQSTGL